MRTTLSLDDDVLEKTRKLAHKLHKPFKFILNEALRVGLADFEKPLKQRDYITKSHNMGLLPGRNLDNVQELLAQAEGEDFK